METAIKSVSDLKNLTDIIFANQNFRNERTDI